MDFFGIKLFAEQKRLQLSRWLGTVRGDYTNKDLVTDWVQLVLLITLSTLVFLK